MIGLLELDASLLTMRRATIVYFALLALRLDLSLSFQIQNTLGPHPFLLQHNGVFLQELRILFTGRPHCT